MERGVGAGTTETFAKSSGAIKSFASYSLSSRLLKYHDESGSYVENFGEFFSYFLASIRRPLVFHPLELAFIVNTIRTNPINKDVFIFQFVIISV